MNQKLVRICLSIALLTGCESTDTRMGLFPTVPFPTVLMTANHHVVCPSDDPSVLGAACRDSDGSALFLRIVPLASNNEVVLLTANNRFVTAEGGGGSRLVAYRNTFGPWETFRLLHVGAGKIALQTWGGQYVSAEGGGGAGLMANRATISTWETFSRVENSTATLQATTPKPYL